MATYIDPTAPAGLTQKQQVGGRQPLAPGAILFLVAGVVAILGAALFFLDTMQTKGKTEELDTVITTKQARLQELQPVEEELKELDQLAKSLHTLFENQKRWEGVLGTTEQRLYRNMKVTALQASDTGEVTFSGEVPSYTDYAKLFTSLTDDQGKRYFATVRPISIEREEDDSGNQGNVKFSFSVTLQEPVLNAEEPLAPETILQQQ